MTHVDLIALAFVGLTALIGLRKGLIASALSVAGIVGGAFFGARLAPHLLSGGSRSPYTPLAGLAGATVGAMVLESIGSVIGSTVRRSLRIPPLRALDSAGGLVTGAAAGLAMVWVVAAAALVLPGQTSLRHGAQRSRIVRELVAIAPPSTLLRALARVDPFPSIAGPAAPVEPPNPRMLRAPGVQAAGPSVVRILGTACGLAVEGSGWVAGPGLVVSAAHVVAGQKHTEVVEPGSRVSLTARTVAFDRRNDIAVLRVPGLNAPALRLAPPFPGRAVAILGYPENGPFAATPGRIGRTALVVSDDAYGHGPVTRTITSLRGDVRHGNSGGPAVDALGRVESTVFAARVGAKAGYGVPQSVVLRALHSARGPVSTGGCAG